MKHFIWVLLFLGFSSIACTENGGYTLETAPWSDETFEVCPTPTDNGLRAVIFEPEVEEWSYKVEYPETTKLVATENGISEIVVNNDKHLPAYYLKEQKIGYLDNRDRWVDENGLPITRIDQLKKNHGEREKPKARGISYEEYAYNPNIEKENAAAMDKINDAAPCTVFELNHYGKLEADFLYDFGNNNPYQCDASIGITRSRKFNYTGKVSRAVALIADGTSYYIKYPSGEVKSYGWTGIERLYNEDGLLICDWNDLGSVIGYELIRDNE